MNTTTKTNQFSCSAMKKNFFAVGKLFPLMNYATQCTKIFFCFLQSLKFGFTPS